MVTLSLLWAKFPAPYTPTVAMTSTDNEISLG
jgi:hypothetical protein